MVVIADVMPRCGLPVAAHMVRYWQCTWPKADLRRAALADELHAADQPGDEAAAIGGHAVEVDEARQRDVPHLWVRRHPVKHPQRDSPRRQGLACTHDCAGGIRC